MESRSSLARSLAVLYVIVGSLLGTSAQAQTLSNGFAVNRYEPTSAGEWSFWVNHPWYSSTRSFAASITLDYAHNPLVFRTLGSDGQLTSQTIVIEHQFLGHVDVAASFLDRIQISGSLPIAFVESGTESMGAAPANGVAAGDPRLGFWVRLFGQPEKSPVSLSLGAQFFIPLRAFGLRTGVSLSTNDEGVMRILPKLALSGYKTHIWWSFNAGFQYRPPAQIGSGADPSGSTVGSELQLGASIAYADFERRFAVGPEVIMATELLGSNATQPFDRGYTSFEILLAGHYNLKRQVNLGLAVGMAQLHLSGTPEGRVLLRLAYAPMKEPQKPVVVVDRDHDGVLDTEDACPNEAGIATPDPRTNGCPDQDRDGVVDRLDVCPETDQGSRPDLDPKRLGCPAGDRDKDGVLDPDDLCADAPAGNKPDPAKPGCPAGDRDKDSVLDPDDLCPDVPRGEKPDPTKPGCPDGDRDKDYVVDHEDACPDQAGAPDPDPKKNGCPGTTTIVDGQIKINEPVFFASKKDVILPRSFPVLEAVASSMTRVKNIKKIRVEGHTDNRGRADYNRDLSARRARSVMRFLIEKGVEEGRLEAAGFGPDKPIADNQSAQGREKNRRVEFMIIDQPQTPGMLVPMPVPVPMPVQNKTDAAPDESKKGRPHHSQEDKAIAADASGREGEGKTAGKKRHHRPKSAKE